jgi:hypothetical protein
MVKENFRFAKLLKLFETITKKKTVFHTITCYDSVIYLSIQNINRDEKNSVKKLFETVTFLVRKLVLNLCPLLALYLNKVLFWK